MRRQLRLILIAATQAGQCIESVLLDPIRKELLAQERVAVEQPKELQELTEPS